MTDTTPISEAGQAELLRIARAVVEAVAQGDPSPEVQSDLTELQPPRGAFVTLHKKGQLRGCIGRFIAHEPAWQVVADMARSAATEDPRFAPVSRAELPDVDIEISALSPMVRTADPLSLELGRHGIYIRRGMHSGTFLPQVATEFGMTKEQFLSQCCAHKAGLPPDAWQDPATEVYLYTAQVFAEKPDTP